MSVIHISTRKRGRHRGKAAPDEVTDDAASIVYGPIETAAHLAVEYAKAEAAKTGHVIHEDYAADLVTMFGEELRHSVSVAVAVMREPITSPNAHIVWDEDGNPRVMTILP